MMVNNESACSYSATGASKCPFAPKRQISAYNWVPAFARGHVDDLRPRWALEEIGACYRIDLVDFRKTRTAEYLLDTFHDWGPDDGNCPS